MRLLLSCQACHSGHQYWSWHRSKLYRFWRTSWELNTKYQGNWKLDPYGQYERLRHAVYRNTIDCLDVLYKPTNCVSVFRSLKLIWLSESICSHQKQEDGTEETNVVGGWLLPDWEPTHCQLRGQVWDVGKRKHGLLGSMSVVLMIVWRSVRRAIWRAKTLLLLLLLLYCIGPERIPSRASIFWYISLDEVLHWYYMSDSGESK